MLISYRLSLLKVWPTDQQHLYHLVLEMQNLRPHPSPKFDLNPQMTVMNIIV